MKKNNKGFMLVEVIVTSTVIVTAMVGFYASFNKLYKNYLAKNQYYNIDAIYATKEMIKEMMNNNPEQFLNNIFSSSVYGDLIKDGICQEENKNGDDIHISICTDISNFYQVKNMIIVEYDKESIQEYLDENPNLHQTFKEYIDYIINYYDITTNEEIGYLFLTEIQDNGNYYYANLRVR